MTHPKTSMPYRAELDGLRAIAVCSVLLFHSGLAWAGSGFVGVDIFFVLSGYLIARVILPEGGGERLNIGSFFERRIRRILPAFFVVLLFVTVLYWPILTPFELNEYGRYLASSSVFLSNFYYGLRFGYFSPEGLQNPLLHTWSISIEVQFYLIAPVILMGLAKLGLRRPGILICVGLLSLASFVSFWFQSAISPQMAYYNVSGRLWEFGLGASVALMSGLPERFRALSAWIAALGLGMIGAASLGGVPDISMVEESIVIAALGSACVLIGGSHHAVARGMSIPPLLFLGKISYSIYLVHWPLFLWWKIWSFSNELSLLEIFLLSAVTIIISYWSWRFVERPAMSKTPGSLVRTGVRYAVIGICLFSLGLVLRQWVPQGAADLLRLSNYSETYLASERFSSQFESLGEHCFLSDKTERDFDFSKLDSCLERTPPKPALYLIGDSHAAAISGAMVEVLPEVDVLPVFAVGCRFLRPFHGTENCRMIMQRTANQTLPKAERSTVVIASRWTIYENKFGRDALLNTLEQMVLELQDTTQHNIIIVGNNPEFFTDLPILQARVKKLSRDASLIKPSRQSQSLNAQMSTTVERLGATYIDVFAAVCGSEPCDWMVDGEPTHFDSNHLIDKASIRVAKAINCALITADERLLSEQQLSCLTNH